MPKGPEAMPVTGGESAEPPASLHWRVRACHLGATAMVVLAVSLGIAVPPAMALAPAGGWSGPVRVSGAGHLASDVELAAGRHGEVAVWTDIRGATADGVIMASQRRLRTGWSRPVALSPRGQIVIDPQIAVAGSGTAAAVWVVAGTDSGRRRPFVQAAFRRGAAGSWSRPVRISPASADAGQAVIGIGGGQAVALWDASATSGSRVEWSTLTVQTGSWSAPRVLARSSQQLLFPQVTLNSLGTAVAVWRRYAARPPRHGIARAQIEAAVRPARHRTWQAPARLGAEFEPADQGAAGLQLPGPHVAISATGQAVVVWQGRTAGTIVTKAAIRSATGSWQQPRALTARSGLYPDVAMSAAGDAVAVWQGPDGSVVTASMPARANRWCAPRVLYSGNPDVAPYPEVAVGNGGEAVAAWSGDTIRAAIRLRAGATWQRPVTLGSGGLPQIALASNGQATTAWQSPQSKPRGTVIRAARYSPPPRMYAATRPAGPALSPAACRRA